MRRLPIYVAALGLALPPLLIAADSPDLRMARNEQFRAAFDAGNYADALPEAMRVVELTRDRFGPEAQEVANPLTNLATTYYRLGEYTMALDTYREVLTLLDLQGNATHPDLVRPLHGMGATLRALQRDEEAAAPLKRAVDITRHRDGLHAISQLPVLRALIATYLALGRIDDAGREEQYAFNVAESAWGRDDIRMLEPIDHLARWNETRGRYSAARALHRRAVLIADIAAPGNVRAVTGLRGIARTYRLAFIYGETPDPMTAAMDMPLPTSNNLIPRGDQSEEGERALRAALQRLEEPAHAGLRGAVLTDLGDWQLIAGHPGRAHDSYRRAWQALAEAGDTTLLSQPSPLVYRPPPMAASQRTESPDEFTLQEVELRVSIGLNGEVRDTTVANPAPERESAERAVTSAVRRSLWRPALRDGAPVAVSDFLFSEPVYIRRARSAS